MILGVAELLRLVKEKNLVEGLSERELTNPEGAGLDLRLKKLYRLTGKGLLGIDKRETPTVELVAEYNPGSARASPSSPASTTSPRPLSE